MNQHISSVCVCVCPSLQHHWQLWGRLAQFVRLCAQCWNVGLVCVCVCVCVCISACICVRLSPCPQHGIVLCWQEQSAPWPFSPSFTNSHTHTHTHTYTHTHAHDSLGAFLERRCRSSQWPLCAPAPSSVVRLTEPLQAASGRKPDSLRCERPSDRVADAPKVSTWVGRKPSFMF